MTDADKLGAAAMLLCLTVGITIGTLHYLRKKATQ